MYMHTEYQHDGVGDANARVGQTRGSVRRLCHTAPVAPRSNSGRASSLWLSPQRGQLTSSPCSFKVSAGRSATEPRPPIFLAPQDPFERPEAWEGKGLWAGAGLAYGLTNCGVVRSTVCTPGWVIRTPVYRAGGGRLVHTGLVTRSSPVALLNENPGARTRTRAGRPTARPCRRPGRRAGDADRGKTRKLLESREMKAKLISR